MRPVSGFDGYFVNEQGQVFSCWRGGRSARRTPSYAPRKVQPWFGKYVTVNLRRDGVGVSVSLHGVVCEAFHGPRPEGCEVRHLDGDKWNNAAANLRWGTPSENQNDRVDHGTDNRGERHGLHKLTAEAVKDIRTRRCPQKVFAEMYGVTQPQISRVQLGTRWSWLDGKGKVMTEGNGTNVAERPRIEPFTRLRSNVKGYIDDTIGPMTAWIGDNRTGKTSRVDAIRLAITGRHPAGPHGSDLMELVPEGSAMLFAELSGPSGATKFIVETEGGKAKKPGKPEPDGLFKAVVSEKDLETILPMQSMRDLIDLGSTRGREAIFRRFGAISAVPVPRGLSESQTKLWNDGLGAVKAGNPKADSAELLSLLAAWMRQTKLSISRAIKGLEGLIKEREQAVKTYAAGEEEIPALREKLKLSEAWDRAESLRQRRAQLDAEGEAYRIKVAPFTEADTRKEAGDAARKKEDADWQLKMAGIRTAAIALQERLKTETKLLHGGEWLVATLELNANKADANGHAPCLLCGNPSFSPAETKTQVEPRVNARRSSWQEAHDEIAKNDAEYRETEAAYKGWVLAGERARQEYEAGKTSLRFEYTRIKSALEEVNRALESSPASYEGPPTDELRRQIKAREDASLLSRQLDQDHAKVRNLHVDHEMAKALEGEATKELSALLGRTSEAAHTAVNTYMPEGFRAEIDLESAKWRVLGADGRPHRRDIMAGSERGALIPALALGWTEGAPARFLILDDDDLAPFSPLNLKRLFDTLKDALDDGLLTQVFITSSRPAEIPDYVTKIFTTGAQLPLHIQANLDQNFGTPEPAPAPAAVPPPAAIAPALDIPAVPMNSGGLLL